MAVIEAVQRELRVGDSVRVEADSLPGGSAEGTIYSVAGTPNQTNLLYAVEIDLPADLQVTNGSFARVVLYTDVQTQALVAPASALLNENGSSYVYLVKDGCATKREVKTGISAEGRVQLLSGVKAGDELIIKGQTYVSEGSPVRVVNAEAAQ